MAGSYRIALARQPRQVAERTRTGAFYSLLPLCMHTEDMSTQAHAHVFVKIP